MKYYYNGKLVRTSKSSTYKYAVMLGDGCKGCYSKIEGARSTFNYYYKMWESNKRCFEEILEGKRSRKCEWTGKNFTDDEINEYIANYNNLMSKLQIVELEARA